MRTILPFIMISFGAVACQGPARSGAVIDRYRSAECVRPCIAKDVWPATRGWDATVIVAGGAKVKIQGADMIDGRIVVRHEPNGPRIVAVEREDFIYPTDVRFDEARGILFVKTSGLAGDRWPQTWLYEYDLKRNRKISRLLVDPEVIPPECPMPGTSESSPQP